MRNKFKVKRKCDTAIAVHTHTQLLICVYKGTRFHEESIAPEPKAMPSLECTCTFCIYIYLYVYKYIKYVCWGTRKSNSRALQFDRNNRSRKMNERFFGSYNGSEELQPSPQMSASYKVSDLLLVHCLLLPNVIDCSLPENRHELPGEQIAEFF